MSIVERILRVFLSYAELAQGWNPQEEDDYQNFVDAVGNALVPVEQAGGVVSDEACAMLRRKLPLGCAGMVGNDEARAALEAVAPLLRAPAEQGVMVDEGMVDRMIEEYRRLEPEDSKLMGISTTNGETRDFCRSLLQAALAQNSQPKTLGDFVRLPDADRVAIGQEVVDRAIEMQNAQGEAVVEVYRMGNGLGSASSPRMQTMINSACEICDGEGWVCESHPDMPWREGSNGCMCSAGKNCVCNPEGALPDSYTVLVDLHTNKIN